MPLPEGLYDLLLTEGLAAQIDPASTQINPVGETAAFALTDSLARQLRRVLEELAEGDEDDPARPVHIVNGLLLKLRERLSELGLQAAARDSIDLISAPMRVLKEIQRNGQFSEQPNIALSAPWLFTAGKGTPSLLDEVRRELQSADRVDILVSFITVSGVRKILDVLQQITAVGATAGSTRIRVLTTTYIGATELRAVEELARLPGCDVRISLDGRRTRLHAKAWLFHRKTGFGSAYVGSANLSGAALTGGLEWTVKISQRSQEALFTRAEATFETLWEDNEFEKYEPDNPKHKEALAQALRREAGGSEDIYSLPRFFDLQPKTYQQDMLEQLQAERAEGRTRNLVVAATGTGKTMVAAFDYRHSCLSGGGRPRLLFVAHREEILRQALRTYREVLRDPDFGELFIQGVEPARLDHVFATIDGVTNRELVKRFGASYWHTVVIDECHRLAADRFEAFATSIRPSILLGLTATPERSDGQPIGHHFHNRPDGGSAVELRLWHALDLQLVAPFEYFGCDDETDFTNVPWNQPGERSALEQLVNDNAARARLVVREWQRLATDARRSKALVFCVSIAHAEFMTAFLNQAGLPAACIVGTTSTAERRAAPRQLMSGELSALVTVDLFNEGVDLPMVDTLLLLRPTQSPVLFQQQIGRGLRLAPGKESCLVLDFVGQHRTDFRFDRLLSSLTGLSKRELLDGAEHGFGSLPPGCHIHLQKQTREQVLSGLRTFSQQSWRRLKAELQAYAALRGRTNVSLPEFLYEHALEPEDVYRASAGKTRSGWTALLRDAGLLTNEPGPEEDYFSRRFSDLLHVDDIVRITAIEGLASAAQHVSTLTPPRMDVLQMLAYQVDGHHSRVGSAVAFGTRIANHKPIEEELLALAHVLKARPHVHTLPLPGLETTPLFLHATYGIREILTAVGWLSADRRTPFQAGVLGLPALKAELLFVTLDKSDGFHETIAYHDYAISAERFHWQSQNSAGPDTPAGKRYLQSPDNGWQFQLFVRARKNQPYRACGPVLLESHEGERPMSIIWRLATPLPIRLFREFSVLRGV